MQHTHTPLLASVIIPTYNRSNILAYTLDSLARQTLDKASFEVIVVDDGSADDTRAVVDQYKDAFPLRYFYQEDQGNRTAMARNTGIRHAASDLCIFVDAGMLLHTGCLAEHLNLHRARPDKIAIIGYAYCFEEYNENDKVLTSLINTGRPDETIAGFEAAGRYLDLREACYRRYRDNLEDLPAPWVFFWTCNVSVPTDSLRRVGLFDENFDQTWGFEDVELAYRLMMDGVKIVLNRSAKAIHYPHGKEDAAFKAYSQERNAAYFHHKHNSWQSKRYLSSSCLQFNDDLLAIMAAQGEPQVQQVPG